MQIPKISISALGRLARLDFSPDEEKRYIEQLPKLVEYVGQLQILSTDTVAEVAPVCPMRPDEAVLSPARESILSAAPERADDFWKVKAVF